MATIAMMVGGAVLNATTFVGGSYLARYLSGSNHDAERKRHDKALGNIRETMKLITRSEKSSWIGTHRK